MQTSAVSNLITDSHPWEKNDQQEATRFPFGLLAGTNKSGANFPSEPRDNSVISTLSWTSIGEEQHEVIGNFEPIGINPDAAAGNVRNKTLDLRGAIPKLDRRQTLNATFLGL